MTIPAPDPTDCRTTVTLTVTLSRCALRALGYLVREGALMWEERLGRVPRIDFYRITGRGLEMLGASWSAGPMHLRA